MINHKLTSQIERLNDLFRKVDSACGSDIEMRSHWAKYLCVLSAGFLENAIEEVFSDFARNAASKPVADFSMSALSKIQNPNMTKFLDIAKSFKPEWAVALEAYVDQDGRREAINSIIKNRHEIAHGKYSGITISQIKQYLEKAIDVVEFIDKQCKT